MSGKKIKVLNILVDGRIAGPTLRVVDMAGRLSEKYSVETVVAMPDHDSEELKLLLKGINIKFITLGLHKLSKSPSLLFRWMFSLIPEVIRLKRIIKREDPDIIHCNGSWQLKGIVAAFGSGKKILWHMNDTYAPFFVRIVFRLLKRIPHAFLTEGERVKNYYFGTGPTDVPVFISQSPVDMNKFDPQSVFIDKKVDSYHGIKIVTAGNVNPCKGFEYFIDASEILNKKYDNLHFFIVGNLFPSQSGYIKTLKDKINKGKFSNVYLHGYSDNIPAILKAADIYVCSSVTEASPQSVWEAMAMEKAVVSTDVGSVADFIKNDFNGYIVDPGDPQALAESMERFLKTPSLKTDFGKKSRMVALENFTLDRIVDEHYKAYSDIINGAI